jgi:hypothetical protein
MFWSPPICWAVQDSIVISGAEFFRPLALVGRRRRSPYEAHASAAAVLGNELDGGSLKRCRTAAMLFG